VCEGISSQWRIDGREEGVNFAPKHAGLKAITLGLLQKMENAVLRTLGLKHAMALLKEMGDSMDQQEYIIRTQGVAYTYGLGKVVSPGVAYFEKGFYDLTKDELNAKLKALGKVMLR
jgi:hypothetical protein